MAKARPQPPRSRRGKHNSKGESEADVAVCLATVASVAKQLGKAEALGTHLAAQQLSCSAGDREQVATQLQRAKQDEQRLRRSLDIVLGQASERCQRSNQTGDDDSVTGGSIGILRAAPFIKKSTAVSRILPPLPPYKKTPCAADMAGELYEVKLLALVFLRAVNAGKPFSLATNMSAAGVFDDLVLRTWIEGNRWSTTFIQQKHKTNNKNIRYATLLSMSKDAAFGLAKYCESVQKIRKDCEEDEALKLCGVYDDHRFIIYTNARAPELGNSEVAFKGDPMFATSTKESAFRFSGTSPVLKGLKEKVQFEELLKQLEQETEVDEIGEKIKDILESFKVSSFNLDLKSRRDALLAEPVMTKLEQTLKETSSELDFESYKECLEKIHLYTGQANEQELDGLIVREIKEALQLAVALEAAKVAKEFVGSVQEWWKEKANGSWLTVESMLWQEMLSSRIQQLSKEMLREIRNVEPEFTDESIFKFQNEIQRCKLLNVIVKEGTTTLIASKVCSALKDERHIVIGSQELFAKRDGVFSVWKMSFCDGLVVVCDNQLTDDQVSMLARDLEHLTSECSDLRCVLVSTKHDKLATSLNNTIVELSTFEDTCKWKDIRSQEWLLARDVFFQGRKMPLMTLVQGVEKVTEQIKGTALAELARGEHRIGMEMEKLEYYVTRTLTRANSATPIHSVSGLARTVLVIAEPGMGKTTLLTHLAQTAKTVDPTTWVVRINLNDTSSYLATLKNRLIDKATAVQFVTEFSRGSGSDLEGSLFRDCLLSKGKVIVFIDGVDEVCPLHTVTICALLKCLQETNITALWVTSRIAQKDALEKALRVKSFGLSPFSLVDQTQFFKAFWKIKFLGNDRALDEFVAKVMKLSIDTFNDQGNFAITIPLQTRMLAEYCDDYFDDKAKAFPKRINILKLFESFVEKKIEIYVSEKKKDNKTNAAIDTDNDKIKRMFMEDHMHAALDLFLTPEELASLDLPSKTYQRFREQVEAGKEKTGIITAIQNEKPCFIHRTFAEYFAAMWMSTNRKTRRSFLRKKLFDPNFQVVKCLFDLELARDSELHEAVLNMNLESVNQLLASGADVNQKDSGGRTALHLIGSCCGDASKKTVRGKITAVLLRKGPDVNITDTLLGWRPLRYADKTGDWTLARMILQAGGKPDDMKEAKRHVKEEVYGTFIKFLSNQNSSSNHLLIAASKHGDLRLIEYLVSERHADVNCRRASDGMRPMHVSAQAGHVDVMRFMYYNKAALEVTDSARNRPLHYAARHRRTAALRFLLKRRVEVNVVNSEGWTPLLYSTSLGHLDGSLMLIGKGAGVNVQNNDGWTPLLYAADRGLSQLVKVIQEKGGTITSKQMKKLTEEQKDVALRFQIDAKVGDKLVMKEARKKKRATRGIAISYQGSAIASRDIARGTATTSQDLARVLAISFLGSAIASRDIARGIATTSQDLARSCVIS